MIYRKNVQPSAHTFSSSSTSEMARCFHPAERGELRAHWMWPLAVLCLMAGAGGMWFYLRTNRDPVPAETPAASHAAAHSPTAEGAQPDGAEGGGQEVSGGGEVIAGGDLPADTGPDNGGLIEEGADKPAKGKKKGKAKGRKAGPKKRRSRGAAAIEAASMVSPLIPAAKLPVEVVKPSEPLPVIALSPIAPYNP